MVKNPYIIRPTLPASAKARTGDVMLIKCRTLSCTARATYHAGAASGMRVNIFYSPDGSNWDTVAYAYYDVNLSAGNTVQETAIIDAPEHGSVKFELENLDAGEAITDAKLWITIQAWPEGKNPNTHQIIGKE
jgi:hypothetical protein